MMAQQALCRPCQEELAWTGEKRLFLPTLLNHLRNCPTCQSFAASVEEMTHLAHLDKADPPPGLVERAMEQLKPELAARARESFWLRTRLALAGMVSLPVIVGLNGLLIWTVYSVLDTRVSEPVAGLAAYVVAASALLGLSLSYGSLPLMAEWGLELRQRCPAFAASAVPHGPEANAFGRSK